MKTRRLIAFMLAALLSTAAGAQADLALSPNVKYVPFRVRIDNLDAHPDFVLVVFPHSMSNGLPRAEARKLSPGKALGFGRRISGKPKLYAFKKTDYEQLTKVPPAIPGDPLGSDSPARPKLRFPNDKAIDCNVVISPRHTTKSGGPDEYLEVYAITRLTDQACSIKLVRGPDGVASAVPASSSPSSSSSATPAGRQPASSEKNKGCSGCATSVPTRTPWALGLLLLVLVLRLRKSAR